LRPLLRTHLLLLTLTPACSCDYFCKFQFRPIHPPSRRLSPSPARDPSPRPVARVRPLRAVQPPPLSPGARRRPLPRLPWRAARPPPPAPWRGTAPPGLLTRRRGPAQPSAPRVRLPGAPACGPCPVRGPWQRGPSRLAQRIPTHAAPARVVIESRLN
jgi:hypothetical protein